MQSIGPNKKKKHEETQQVVTGRDAICRLGVFKDIASVGHLASKHPNVVCPKNFHCHSKPFTNSYFFPGCQPTNFCFVMSALLSAVGSAHCRDVQHIHSQLTGPGLSEVVPTIPTSSAICTCASATCSDCRFMNCTCASSKCFRAFEFEINRNSTKDENVKALRV